MTETPENHYTIPAPAWPEFVAKIAKLNKRAAKLGCQPITYVLLAEGEAVREHTFKTGDGEYTKKYKVKTKTIELTGAAPVLEGYRFIARIEYLSDGKSTLFHQVPGSQGSLVRIKETGDVGVWVQTRAMGREGERLTIMGSREDTYLTVPPGYVPGQFIEPAGA